MLCSTFLKTVWVPCDVHLHVQTDWLFFTGSLNEMKQSQRGLRERGQEDVSFMGNVVLICRKTKYCAQHL